MRIKHNGKVARDLNILFNLGTIRELTDGQLLERFATQQGEAAELAFAALVERHGAMVLRVCQAQLRDPHDTQDAFQVTFLILLKKARSLWVRDSLGPWLHQVAYRTAACARSNAARRCRHEQTLAEAPRPASNPVDTELEQALHTEIDRLPERYRVPIVLCDLEGQTCEEAARKMGCAVGTIKSWRHRGRERLRARLSKLGLFPTSRYASATAWTPALGGTLKPVSEAALNNAVQGVLQGLTSGVVPASALNLAKGVLQTMLVSKLRALMFGVFAVASLSTGLGALSWGAEGDQTVGLVPKVEAPQMALAGVEIEAPPAKEADSKEWSLSFREAIRIGLANDPSVHLLTTKEGEFPIRIEPKDRQADVGKFKRDVAERTAHIEGLYWGLARSLQWHLSALKQQELVKQVFDREKLRPAKGEADEKEIKRVEAQWTISQAIVSNTTRQIDHTQNTLKQLMRLPATDQRRIVPSSSPDELDLEGVELNGELPKWDGPVDDTKSTELVDRGVLREVQDRLDASGERSRDAFNIALVEVEQSRKFDQTVLSLGGTKQKLAAVEKRLAETDKFLDQHLELYQTGKQPAKAYLNAVIGYFENSIRPRYAHQTSIASDMLAIKTAKGTLLDHQKVVVVEEPNDSPPKPREDQPDDVQKQAPSPLALTTPKLLPKPGEIWQMPLREAIHIGLRNYEAVRVVSQLETDSPWQITASDKGANLDVLRANASGLSNTIATMYWDLSSAYVYLWSKEKAVELASELLRREQAKLELGTGTTARVDEVKRRLRHFEGELADKTGIVMSTERRLRERLGLSPIGDRRIVPTTPPFEAKLDVDWNQARATMLEKNPEIALARGRVQASLKIPVEGKKTIETEQDRLEQADLLKQTIHAKTSALAGFAEPIGKTFERFPEAALAREASAAKLEKQLDLVEVGKIPIAGYLDAVSEYATAIEHEASMKSSYNAFIAGFDQTRGTLLRSHQIEVVNGEPKPAKTPDVEPELPTAAIDNLAHALDRLSELTGADSETGDRTETVEVSLSEAVRSALGNIESVHLISTAKDEFPIKIEQADKLEDAQKFKVEVMKRLLSVEDQYWKCLQINAEDQALKNGWKRQSQFWKIEQTWLGSGKLDPERIAQLSHEVEAQRLPAEFAQKDLLRQQSVFRQFLGWPQDDKRRIIFQVTPDDLQLPKDSPATAMAINANPSNIPLQDLERFRDVFDDKTDKTLDQFRSAVLTVEHLKRLRKFRQDMIDARAALDETTSLSAIASEHLENVKRPVADDANGTDRARSSLERYVKLQVEEARQKTYFARSKARFLELNGTLLEHLKVEIIATPKPADAKVEGASK